MGQDKLYNFLKDNKGQWFRSDILSEQIGMQKNAVSKYIIKMLRFIGVNEGLEKKMSYERINNSIYKTKVAYYRVNI